MRKVLHSIVVSLSHTRIYKERVDMVRRLLLAVSHPYSTFFNLIRHPQLLTEHTSGWFAVLLGYSILSRHLKVSDTVFVTLSAALPYQVWSVLFITIGIFQLVSAVILSTPHKGFATLASFVMWLFLTILFYLGPEAPGVAMIFPVMTISCGLSYLSIIKDSSEIEALLG